MRQWQEIQEVLWRRSNCALSALTQRARQSRRHNCHTSSAPHLRGEVAEPGDERRFTSGLGLLGHLQSIIDLDAKVAHGTFQLAVAKQELYGT